MFMAVFVRNIQRAALPLKRKSPAILFKTTGNPLELFFRSSWTHLGFLRYHRGVPLGWCPRLRESV